MIALTFFNPLLLWALPLAAVPIIIHLLNRRRFNKVPWAAMEYLLRAMKRNRRRMQMEHWLVLLLRTLAVIFLISLVTRPQLASTGGLLTSTTHHLVCLDDSASMAQRVGAGNVYKSSVARVHSLVGKLIDTNAGDLFTLLVSSQRDREPMLFAVRINQELKRKVREALSGQTVGESSLNVGPFLAAAKKWAVEKSKEARDFHYYLVTDSRAHDFVRAGKPAPGVLKHLEEMDPAHAKMTMFLVGPKDTENLGITAVRRRDRLAMAGTSVTLEVEIWNFGDDNSAATEVVVEIDGKTRVVRPVEPIAAGDKAVVDVEHTFREPGYHGIVATIPKDKYPVDDEGALALEVVGSSQVLVINGDPGQTPEESETFYLNKALDLGTDIITGIDVTEIPPSSLQEYDLTDINMVWLANVAYRDLDERDVQKLEDYCAAGGGVVFFLGDQINAVAYNKFFHKDGKGLLPLPVLEMKGDVDNPDNAFIADRTHYAIRDNADVLDVILSRMVLVRRYYELGEDPADPVSIPVRVKGRNGHPLFATKTFRRGGQTAVFATTADDQYSDFCISPAYLVMCQEIHKHATKIHAIDAYNLDSSGTLKVELDPAEYRRDIFLRALGDSGFEETFTATDRKPEEGAKPDGKIISDLRIDMQRLRGLGLFQITLTPHRGEAENRLMTRRAPSDEGRLQKADKAMLLRTFPQEVHDRLDIQEQTKADPAVASVGEGELWRLLAIAMLLFLLLETVLAWRFGRR